MARIDGTQSLEFEEMPRYLKLYIEGRITKDAEEAAAKGTDSDYEREVRAALAAAFGGPSGFMQQFVEDRIAAGVEKSAAVAEFQVLFAKKCVCVFGVATHSCAHEQTFTPNEVDIIEAMRAHEKTEGALGALASFAEENPVLFAGVVMTHDMPAGTAPVNPFGFKVLPPLSDIPATGPALVLNEDIERRLRDDALAKNFANFEYRVRWNGKAADPKGGHRVRFEATFVDLKRFEVTCTMSEGWLRRYPRGNVCASMLYGRTFPSIEAFAVACQNAMGENVTSVSLDGSIYVYSLVEDDE
jgi:hypothetical protein